ncbi:hypothetical protein BST61_g1604 [Cercospora zeina]
MDRVCRLCGQSRFLAETASRNESTPQDLDCMKIRSCCHRLTYPSLDARPRATTAPLYAMRPGGAGRSFDSSGGLQSPHMDMDPEF